MSLVCEEKNSPLKIPKKESKLEDSVKVKENQVLDEVAAKVDGLRIQHDVSNQTVTSPEEMEERQIYEQDMISIISEYRLVCKERDHFEELSSSILHCLRLFEDEMRRKGMLEELENRPVEEMKEEPQQKVPANTPATPTKQQEGATKFSFDVVKEEQTETAAEASKQTNEEESSGDQKLSVLGDILKTVKKEDLLRVVFAMRRQIDFLEDQVEEMKENIQEFLNSSDTSYDSYDTCADEETATDDEVADKTVHYTADPLDCVTKPVDEDGDSEEWQFDTEDTAAADCQY